MAKKPALEKGKTIKPQSIAAESAPHVVKTLKEQLAEQKPHLNHIDTDVADSKNEYSSKLTDEWKEVTEKSVNQ